MKISFKMECEEKQQIGVSDTNGEAQTQNEKEIKMGEFIPRCSCCLHSDNLRSLWREFSNDGVTEIYGSMLIECFALALDIPSEPAASTDQICARCVRRLRDAVSFKSQVIDCAKILSQDLAAKIKQEIEIDVELELGAQPHCLQQYDDEGSLPAAPSLADGRQVKPDDPIDIIKVEIYPIEPAKCKPERTARRTVPKQYKRYTGDDVRKAVEAVRGNTMSQNKASKTFKVPCRVLSKALKENQENGDKTDSKVLERCPRNPARERRHYPEQNLLQAFDEVWNKRMTQTQASKLYNVPRSTIFDLISKNLGKPRRDGRKKTDKRPQEMQKHTTNILTIMEYSNATPIRCHGDGGYLCCFCSQQYQQPSDLKNHTISSHDLKTRRTITKGKRPSSYFVKLDISYLKCTICNSDMVSLEKLIEHLIDDHQKPMYTDIKNQILPFKFESAELQCSVCSNVYSKFKLLLEHLNGHYRNYVCEECNAGFVTRMILHNHVRGHKTGVFTCDVCLRVYSTLRKLTYHKNLVHTHSYFVSKCGYCNEKFKSYHRKREHLIQAHNVEPETFSCKACNRVFKSQASLRVHRKRDHLMERKFKCTECEMEFFGRAELNAHMLKHSGVREFQCDVCQKMFKRKYTLTEHMRIHENDCRFKCEQCRVGFVQKCSWKGHMRNKHGIII